MKIKTSITVDKGSLETVDQLSGQHKNRSDAAKVREQLAPWRKQQQSGG